MCRMYVVSLSKLLVLMSRIAVLLFGSINASEKYLDIAQLGYEQYQDIIIDGVVVQPANYNHRDCSIRYEMINTVLKQYNRPFTMLDIGASQGYYSFRAAADYPQSVFVMVEDNNHDYPMSGTQLLDLCKANSKLNNVIFLKKILTIADAKRFSECEHMDVVLALNIIHWFKDSWQEITDILLRMGSNIIIETPPQEVIVGEDNNSYRAAIESYLIEKKAVVIGKVPRHTSDSVATVYLIEGQKST